jgi:hypothetical protein
VISEPRIYSEFVFCFCFFDENSEFGLVLLLFLEVERRKVNKAKKSDFELRVRIQFCVSSLGNFSMARISDPFVTVWIVTLKNPQSAEVWI